MFRHCYFPGASVQATVISFIYSFNFSPLLIEGQNGCFYCYIRGTGMLQHSRVLTENTMAVFCPFYSLYTFNIYASRFFPPFIFLGLWTHFKTKIYSFLFDTGSMITDTKPRRILMSPSPTKYIEV